MNPDEPVYLERDPAQHMLCTWTRVARTDGGHGPSVFQPTSFAEWADQVHETLAQSERNPGGERDVSVPGTQVWLVAESLDELRDRLRLVGEQTEPAVEAIERLRRTMYETLGYTRED